MDTRPSRQTGSDCFLDALRSHRCARGIDDLPPVRELEKGYRKWAADSVHRRQTEQVVGKGEPDIHGHAGWAKRAAAQDRARRVVVNVRPYAVTAQRLE